MNRMLCLLPVCALLCACASNPNEPGGQSPNKVAEINTQMGQGYMNRGQNEIALEKLKKAIKADPDYAPAHTVLAVLYERLGETEQAQEHFAEAVKVAPDNGDVNNNYGAFLCRIGEPDRSERYFRQALEDPFYATPEVSTANAGLCMLQAGHMDKAESYLRQSLGFDADFPDALLGLSRLNFTKGDYMRARAFLQRYEAVGPATPASLLLGYRIETQLGNSRAAGSHAEMLQQQFPKSAEAASIREARL